MAGEGRKSRTSASRREVLKAATGLAAGTAALTLPAGTAAAQAGNGGDAATLERLIGANPATRRVLFKGGTILSVDPATGNFAQGDILITGKTIAAVGRDLGAAAQDGNAIVVDAAGSILIPGMVDCHRHSWEGQLRAIIADSTTIGEYMAATHQGFAPFYAPDDMYAGNP